MTDSETNDTKSNKAVYWSLFICSGYCGFVGIGTLIMALALGYIIQFTFKVLKFDVNSIKHRLIDEDIKPLKAKLLKGKSPDIYME